MPHFECGAFNHSTTSPTRALTPAGPITLSHGKGRVVGPRPRHQAERTGPASAGRRRSPRHIGDGWWKRKRTVTWRDKLDFAPQAGPSVCLVVGTAPAWGWCGRGQSHIDFAGGLDDSAARDQRGAVLSARRTRKLKGNQLCMLSLRQAASSTVWQRTSF